MYADRDLPKGALRYVIPCLMSTMAWSRESTENLQTPASCAELAAVYDAAGADELTFST